MLINPFCKTMPIIILLLLIITNCTSLRTVERHHQSFNENAKLQIEALKHFEQQFSVMPGQVTLLNFPYYGPFEAESLVCNEQKVPFFASNIKHFARAYLVRSYFDESEEYECIFSFSVAVQDKTYQIKNAIKTIMVQNYEYPREELQVAREKVDLSTQDAEQALKENKELEKIFLQSASSLLFDEAFKLPLTSKITSIFGTKRIFNKTKQSEHLGTDFRAAIGTKITPANKGIVVFAGELFFGGKTVVIDHGLGIFTTYSHLSEIFSEVGQQATKETILGLSGRSGRVNGPHLHWGIKIHGHWVDGHSLIQASQENFSNQIFVDTKR